MRKVIASINITLDGFMAGPQGELDWHFPHWNEEMADYAYAQLSMSDCILLGRVTYQEMARYWPVERNYPAGARQDVAYARMMNEYDKIVFSRTLEKAEWQNTRLIKRNIAREIARLKQQPGMDMIIFGSSSIIANLQQAGLIDEYVLWVHPLLLGRGKPLFGNLQNRQMLTLLKTKSFSSGVVVLYYEAGNNTVPCKISGMEKYSMDNDIRVFCVTADSFPDGIKAAHQQLHAMLPSVANRKFFGISYPNREGNIIYKAAVEELYSGEAQEYGRETFTIKKGDYLSETVNNWQRNAADIETTFQILLSDPRLDRNGYCLEMYPNEKDMVCMVKLDPAKVSS